MAYYCISGRNALQCWVAVRHGIALESLQSFAASEYNYYRSVKTMQTPALTCCLLHVQAWPLSPQKKSLYWR